MKLSHLLLRVALPTALIALSGTAACNSKRVNKTNPVLQTTVRISLSSTGTEGNLECVNDSIGVSNDGRYVAFTSKATNLVAGDTNARADVFVRDNIGKTLTMVSVNLIGGPSNGASTLPSMSGDGRYVAFASLATNLTGDVVPAGKRQIYVRDMVTQITTLVSRGTGGGLISDLDCTNPKISNDGVYVVFESLSEVLDNTALGGVDSDTNSDIWRRQVIDGTSAFPTDLISVQSNTGPPTVNAVIKGNGHSFRPCVSGDGRYVAFESDATNLVLTGGIIGDGGPDTNVKTDVFVRDTQTARTVRCSTDFSNTPDTLLWGPSSAASISLDGKLVAFRSVSGTLHPVAQEAVPNVYVRSWDDSTAAQFTEVLSVHTSGATGGQNCDKPSISGDGTKIAWQSPSSSLVNGDSNGVLDVFLRNRTTLQTSRESVQTFGAQLDAQSGIPIYTPDGRYIVFWSQATNAVDDDLNGAADIFMRGPPFE
jgi:Tol biopolymer transport system component